MKKISIQIIIILIATLLINTGCKKYEYATKTILGKPVVSGITQTKASISNEIIEIGTYLNTYGHCYGTESNPTIDNGITVHSGEGAAVGDFSEEITGLSPNTTYYLRAYAEDTKIRYGLTEEIFTTNEYLSATVVTEEVTNISNNSATCGGNVTSDGESDIIARGVCWNTSGNPLITDNKTNDGIGVGTFTSNINGLTEYTTYHVRAYATNSKGTTYGQEMTFYSASKLVDYDLNEYNVIKIGNQVWMSENLKVTHYKDGGLIDLKSTQIDWSGLTVHSKAYCYFQNDPVNKDIYGLLYSWAGASDDNTNSTNGVCPDGWHLPNKSEWLELTAYLEGNTVAGGKMKTIGTWQLGTGLWEDPNTGATNESGFSALPGGYRGVAGIFSNYRIFGYFWSSTVNEVDSNNAYACLLENNRMSAEVSGTESKKRGLAVRCVKD